MRSGKCSCISFQDSFGCLRSFSSTSRLSSVRENLHRRRLAHIALGTGTIWDVSSEGDNVEARLVLAHKSNAGSSITITFRDPIVNHSTKHWTGHRSPPSLLDMNVVKLVEVSSSVFRVGGSGRAPFRFRSRLRRCVAIVGFTSTECTLDCGVRCGDGLTEPRVHKRVRRCRRRVSGGSSPSLPSVSAASVVAALREECARSLIGAPEE